MRFALVNGERALPTPRQQGVCPACGANLLSRCGTSRVWHWAHKGERSCDSWWEPETEWHRRWKEHFPYEWQEVIHRDPITGERHFADVRTAHGLVLEFQYSPLPSQERKAREGAYGNLVWIVSGTRLKGDLRRFQKNGPTLWQAAPDVRGTYSPEAYFPADWVNSSKPVIFDFEGLPDGRVKQGKLWCLLPGRFDQAALVVQLNREDFIGRALKGAAILPFTGWGRGPD